jgi:Na+-translocating ferredoxin:NAD+ oxidoreductase subunit D
MLRVSSPHAHGAMSTQRIMQQVLLATVPGIVVLTHFFGFGTLVNMVWGSAVALACEALALKLRRRPPGFYLKDCSALVTAFLLGIALPPYSPWWLVAIGIASAILLAKHAYGGLGYNPFNPAMAGYAILLISFPQQMTAWAPPRGVVHELPGLLDALRACFHPAAYDGITMATPLDVGRHNTGLLVADMWRQNPQFGRWAGIGWEWANIAFLAGGLWLLYRRIFTWHAPLAMLASLSLLALLFYDSGSSASGGSPLFHLLSGATMLGAFFIVTDPVTSAVSRTGRLVYGALIGALVYLIRVRGNYPDALAFAVLMANFAAPFIDYYTQPRSYGHDKGHGRQGEQ